MKIAHIATVDLSIRYLLLNQLRTIQAAGHQVVAISSPGPYIKEVEAAGIRHLAVPMTRNLTPFADAVALFRLVRLLRRERFDVVHTHTPKGGLLGQYASWLARTPIRMHTIHGLYFPEGARWRWPFVFMERLTMLFSHLNLSQNPEDVPVAIDEKICRADRIELLGNGIDIRRFDPAPFPPERRHAIRASLDLTPENVVVGIVARVVAEKGYRELFEAARAIHAQEPNVRFVVVGAKDTDKSDALDPVDLGGPELAPFVRYLGHRSDLPELLSTFDIFALPSYREGFPRAAMEAAAMGVPGVLTNIRGCRQVVEDGRTGYLVPVRDAGPLAEAILKLVRDREMRQRFGAAARAKAVAEFDERVVFQRVVDAYDRLGTRLKRS